MVIIVIVMMSSCLKKRLQQTLAIVTVELMMLRKVRMLRELCMC